MNPKLGATIDIRASWGGRACVWVLLASGAGCAQLVGITETEVENLDGVGGAEGNGTPANGGSSPGGLGGSGIGGVQGNAAANGSSPVQRPDPALGGASTLGGEPDARAPIAADAGCSDGSARCAPGGREVCSAGSWQLAPCPASAPACQAGACIVRGPALVAVGDFFVDATEVTVAQYGEFLAATNGDTSGQPSVCGFNTSYYDSSIPMNPSDWPMTNVDWCDAYAYCAWAGKHLCGRIGGGAISAAEVLTQNVSQWFLACGGPGGSTHPNANPDCNSNGGFGNLAPVASFAGCEGFYPGLFDLEGNVAEWVDSCDGNTGAADICLLLGGNIIDNVSYCTEYYDTYRRDETADVFGFRCCSG